jgi:beta-phosphoglucomutase-like phosphatase (HAD superfamily)
VMELPGLTLEKRSHVDSTLRTLIDAGWNLGVISNVISYAGVPRAMRYFGLETYFNPVILSSEFGFRKPDPSIFHHAATIAGVPASECWYVGDTVSRDVLGARRAGFRGVVLIRGTIEQVAQKWLDRYEPAWFTPDAIIDDLAELPKVIETAEQARPGRSGVQAVLIDEQTLQSDGTSHEGETVQIAEAAQRMKQLGIYIGIIAHQETSLQEKLHLYEQAGFGHCIDSITLPGRDQCLRAVRQLQVEPAHCVLISTDKHTREAARLLGIRPLGRDALQRIVTDATRYDLDQLFSDTQRLPR